MPVATERTVSIMSGMNWIAERNRNKLIDGLQEGLIPVRCGAIRSEGMIATRWRVPSHSEAGTHRIVEDVLNWDGIRVTSCSCPWGKDEGPFQGANATPCKHALVVWFYSLAAPERAALIHADYGIRYAFLQGARKSQSEYIVVED
jgi:hypothetical protein